MATFSLGKHPHVELCDLLKLEGWSESTAGVRSFKDINANAIKYVRRIEELIGAPVSWRKRCATPSPSSPRTR